MPTVSLGPIPFFQFTDNDGKFLPYGKLYTYNWNTRQPKATYFDPAGLKARSNPIETNEIGRIREIFFELDVPYYLELKDRFGKLIWSTDEPYIPATGEGTNVTTNIDDHNLFINGQFRWFDIGEYKPLPASIPNLARGGWSFERDGTNPEASITFRRYTLDNTGVPTSPVYYLNYVADEPGSGESKVDVVFTIRDVRTLANTQFSVGFDARSAIAGTYNIQVKLVQHFGTGGSPSADVVTDIATVTPTTTAATYSSTITIPDLTGKTLGTNGDDYIQVRFRMPLNSIANLELTNFYSKRGSAAVDYLYETSDEELGIIKALELPDFNPITDFDTDATVYPSDQAYDVMTLVPLGGGVLTQMYMPALPVGTPLLWFTETAPAGYLFVKGQDLVRSGQYNRLYTVIQDFVGIPENNIVATLNGSVVTVVCQQFGIASPVTAGTTPFTVERIAQGFVSQIASVSGTINTNTYRTIFNGDLIPAAGPGDSGLTVTIISNGSVSTPAEWTITAKAANQLTPSTSFNYATTLDNLGTIGYFTVYFVIDGVGTAPSAPGRTVRPVYLDSADTDAIVNQKLLYAIVGLESSLLSCTSAALLTPGQYFTFGIVGSNYLIWYTIDGSGTAPDLAGITNVRVDLSSTDTALQVATKTYNALNPLLYTLPDARGLFPRFWDNGAGVDPDAATRTAQGTATLTGDHVGTIQQDELKSHNHPPAPGATGFIMQNDGEGNTTPGSLIGQASTTGNTGGNETRPKNMYFALIIKY